MRKLTLGEDVVDLGGLILAWVARKAQTAGQSLSPREDLTREQAVFRRLRAMGMREHPSRNNNERRR
jgi:predicted metalloendopeptidase